MKVWMSAFTWIKFLWRIWPGLFIKKPTTIQNEGMNVSIYIDDFLWCIWPGLFIKKPTTIQNEHVNVSFYMNVAWIWHIWPGLSIKETTTIQNEHMNVSFYMDSVSMTYGKIHVIKAKVIFENTQGKQPFWSSNIPKIDQNCDT